MNLQVEGLGSADIEAFVALLRESFASEQLELTIYACRGVSNFIAYELQVPAALSNSHYFVLKDGTEIIAAVVLRRIHELLHLDYIVTKATARSQGLARKLWLEATERIQSGVNLLSLDVFSSNHVAFNWYCNLGFTEMSRSSLWSCQMVANNHVPAKLINYPQSQAVQEKFGFSQLNLVTEKQEFTVGRLGDKWYRINNIDALSNPAVLRCLHELDPSRRVLAIVPPDFQFSPTLFADCALRDKQIHMRLRYDKWTYRKS
jgi:ribosomal protein S18 acetylase RimI-like enzyme